MPTPAPETLNIPLPGITVHRPARRGDGWRIALGRFEGRGTTLAAAKDHLAAQLTTTVETLAAEPAFARDDDGALVVAIDRPWGIDWYRATDTSARLICTGQRHPEGPAADLSRVHHYTPLPAHTGARTAGAPRPHLYTHDEAAAAIAKGREVAEGFTDDANALDMFTNAALATLANPLAQYPPADPTATKENGHTVTVRTAGKRYVSEFSQLPGRTFGPWDMTEMIRDLTVSALLEQSAARDLVMDAAAHGAATTNTKH
ncbi:hypothetical protein ABT024_05140 [Streptomyces sp. NPDC002812]|uniref:hypothetical protein n=1 Tax=Streptomyces sp. NPDC002812 TaxID=3154434 RepID=UPI0033170605